MSKGLTWKEWQAKANKEYKKNVFTAKDMLQQWGFPTDVDPETVQVLFRKGQAGTKNRQTRRLNKSNSEKSRRESLRSISTREFAEWGRRNGFSQAQIDAAVKWERQTKSKQTKEVRDSEGALQADHITPQPSKKRLNLRERFNRVLPGDAAANRQVKPTAINNDKSDRWLTTQERRAAGAPLTRSAAIRQAFQASAYEVGGGVVRPIESSNDRIRVPSQYSFESSLSPINGNGILNGNGSIAAKTNGDAESSAFDLGFKLAN